MRTKTPPPAYTVVDDCPERRFGMDLYKDDFRYPSVNDWVGYIKARVFTANGAIPLPGATVTIGSAEENGERIALELQTDENGETPTAEVPTPQASAGDVPGETRPYAVYDIEAYLPGYYPYRSLRIPVFGDTLTVQPIGLVPLPLYDGDEVRPEIPGDGIEGA